MRKNERCSNSGQFPEGCSSKNTGGSYRLYGDPTEIELLMAMVSGRDLTKKNTVEKLKDLIDGNMRAYVGDKLSKSFALMECAIGSVAELEGAEDHWNDFLDICKKIELHIIEEMMSDEIRDRKPPVS